MQRAGRWVFSASAALLIAALTPTTASATPTSRLVYSRGADATSCPDEAALQHAVAARVGYDPFFPWAKRTIVVGMAKSEHGFLATVELIDEEGVRHGGHELRATGACGELLDAVALAVVIAIDPKLLASPAPSTPPAPPEPPPPPPPVAPPPEPPPAVVVPSPPEVPPPPPAKDPIRFEASLGPTVGIGFAKTISPGGTVGVGVAWRRFSTGVEAFVAAPIDSKTTLNNGGTFYDWPTLVTLVPCVHVGPLFGCALLQGGALHASAASVPGGTASSTAWWAAGGRLGGELPMRAPFSLRAHVDLLGDLDPPNLTIGKNLLWGAPPVAGALGVEAVVHFP